VGDQNTILDAVAARHLLRRTGFGAPPEQVAKLVGQTRGDAANSLLAFKPQSFRPSGTYGDALRDKWLKYMVKAKQPLQEKLTLFWHDHFSTGIDKVGNAAWMADQNKLLRLSGKGNFRTLLKAINKDKAMMEYLDTVRNYKAIPNENYARELLELFVLGVTDLNGAPNYTQEDIVQIARAFTGWDAYGRGPTHLHDYDHDYMDEFPERGPKRIFVNAHGFGPGGADFTLPGGEGEAEIDQVIDILLQHRDSDNQITAARYVARRLLTYFAHGAPTKTEIDAVVTASGFASSWDLRELLRAILVSDTFYSTAAGPPYGVSSPKSVKWPIDFVIDTLRLLKMTPAGRDQYLNHGSYAPVRDYLANMGQILFEPPSVFGWDWETGWISSSTLLARFEFATDVVRARGNGGTAFRPEKLPAIKALMKFGPATAPVIVDTATGILGITDQLSADERSVLIDYLGGNAAVLDLADYDLRNTKLHGLFALLLQTPVYQLH